jgi:hypothetical protein
MKKFPGNINVKNKENFKKIYYNRIKCYLRRTIYEHMLKNEESNYFSIEEFNTEKKIENPEITIKIISELIPELIAVGWKCTLAFGKTGLYIYSTEKSPYTWEDEQ